MKRSLIPFVAFFVLLLVIVPFFFDFSTSIVPGWHTAIFSPYLILTIVLVIVLLPVMLGYWLLSKRVDTVNWPIFAFHFILTVPIIILLKSPLEFLNVQQTSQGELINTLSMQIKFIAIACTLFMVGQALFIIYFFRTVNSKRIVP